MKLWPDKARHAVPAPGLFSYLCFFKWRPNQRRNAACPPTAYLPANVLITSFSFRLLSSATLVSNVSTNDLTTNDAKH
jgi:hypothetical protein